LTGFKIKCNEKFAGGLAAPAENLAVTPTYFPCTLAGTSALVEMNGCTYDLNAGVELAKGFFVGSMGIVCPPGKEIVVNNGWCIVTFPPQANLGGASYKNEANGEFDATFAVRPIRYAANANCPSGAGNFANGEYDGVMAVKGNAGPVWVE
jgi:hypothetical protein